MPAIINSRSGLRAVIAASLLVLAACRSDPIVDTKGIDQAKYQQDLSQCNAYADQVSTGKQAGKSAAGGAAIGALIGAIVGNSSTVVQSAGVGGVLGGAQGAAGGEQSKDQVVRNCLRGRGYSVLN